MGPSSMSHELPPPRDVELRRKLKWHLEVSAELARQAEELNYGEIAEALYELIDATDELVREMPGREPL